MGLNSSSAKVLCGVRFIADDLQSVAMIGRQHLVADPRVLDRIYSLHGTRAPPPSKFAEPFFEALGASVVHSIDASDFEGATHVHDMNVPICDALKGAYSLVFDGGTLEHIFDVPKALANAMQMVRVGGYFVQEVPANNQMGHGFWQFCPEYAYRTFTPHYGFEIVAVLVQEGTRSFYLAHDPQQLGWRVQLQNRLPTSLTVIARKTAERPIFTPPPQQSDYSALWEGNDRTDVVPRLRLVDILRKFIPAGLERSLRPTFQNRAHRKISDADIMRGNFGPIS